MRIINCVAKWPGAVHDARRILHESPLFAAFESARKPFTGMLLGDSGYMLRDWLLTPILNPHTPKEQAYIDALCVTRCTVERCIGVLKRRWHRLHGEIRLATRRVCKVITACVVLHNRAMSLRLAPPEGEEAAPAQPPAQRLIRWHVDEAGCGHLPPGHLLPGLLPPGLLPPGLLPPWSIAPRSFAPWSFAPTLNGCCNQSLSKCKIRTYFIGNEIINN